MLVVASMVLIALAAVFSDKEAVAAIFALGGVALIMVGVMMPRIQGQLKFGPTGFELWLSELGAELGERTRGLSVETKAEVLDELVETASALDELAKRLEARSGADDSVPPAHETASGLASRVVSWAQEGLELERAFAQWLEHEGWSVQMNVLGRDRYGEMFEVDAVATRDGDRLLVDVKPFFYYGHIITATARQLLRMRQMWQSESVDQVRLALVIGEYPPAGVLEMVRSEIEDVEVYIYVRANSSFERLA